MPVYTVLGTGYFMLLPYFQRACASYHMMARNKNSINYAIFEDYRLYSRMPIFLALVILIQTFIARRSETKEPTHSL
jgi:hypothetical protein